MRTTSYTDNRTRRTVPVLRSLIAGFAAIGAMAMMATPASAQMACGERDKIIGELTETWDENRTAIGLSNTGAVIEVFSSPNGTWTMLLTRPDGPTCLIGAGDHWEDLMVEVAVGEPV